MADTELRHAANGIFLGEMAILRNLLKSFDPDLNEALEIVATEAAELHWRITFALLSARHLPITCGADKDAIDGVDIAAAFEKFVRDKESSLGTARVARLIIPPPYGRVVADLMRRWASDVAAQIDRERELVERKQLVLLAMASAATAAVGMLFTSITLFISALLRLSAFIGH